MIGLLWHRWPVNMTASISLIALGLHSQWITNYTFNEFTASESLTALGIGLASQSVNHRLHSDLLHGQSITNCIWNWTHFTVSESQTTLWLASGQSVSNCTWNWTRFTVSESPTTLWLTSQSINHWLHLELDSLHSWWITNHTLTYFTVNQSLTALGIWLTSQLVNHQLHSNLLHGQSITNCTWNWTRFTVSESPTTLGLTSRSINH